MGVDFGFARIGLAVLEKEMGIISARTPLKASGSLKKDASTIAEIARRENIDEVVIGLPVEASGEEGRMARIVRQLAGHLEAAGRTVRLVDESMSSVEADAGLREFGMKASQRRKVRDGEAARIILERYLHDQAGS